MNQLENLSRLKRYIAEKMRIPEDAIYIKYIDMNQYPGPNKYVSSFIEENGYSPIEIEEIKRAANYNWTLRKLSKSIERRTGLPRDSILFKKGSQKIHGKTYVDQLRKMFQEN